MFNTNIIVQQNQQQGGPEGQMMGTQKMPDSDAEQQSPPQQWDSDY